MRYLVSLFALLLCVSPFHFIQAAEDEPIDFAAIVKEKHLGEIKTGVITIGNNTATIDLTGLDYVFLDPKATRFVLEEVWENLPDETVLGMIVPKDFPNGTNEWGIAINENTDGYISDDDAKDIKPDSLLQELKKMNEETNARKKEKGYTNIAYLIDWVIPPSYDSTGKKLIWGTKSRWEEDKEATMFNYEMRILGKSGYLQLEALSGLDQLEAVKAGSVQILERVNFTEGKTYEDYNWMTDKTAEIGLLGLLGVAAAKKTGILAAIGIFLIKFWKIAIIGVFAFGGGMYNWITNRKPKKQEEQKEEETNEESNQKPQEDTPSLGR